MCAPARTRWSDQALQQMRAPILGYLAHAAAVARGEQVSLTSVKVAIDHHVAGDDDMGGGRLCRLIHRWPTLAGISEREVTAVPRGLSKGVQPHLAKVAKPLSTAWNDS